MTPPETSTLDRSGPRPHGRPASRSPRAGRTGRPGRTPRRPRSLALVSVWGGVVAALGPLVGCAVLGLLGWFLADAGTHGAPRDGLRVGALAWLMGHGSGVVVDDVPVTLLPLGVTLLVVWSTWRRSLRTGVALAGHGPDADRLADGERDWTVPLATGFFALGYLVVVLLTELAAWPLAPVANTFRLVLLTLLLAAGLGGAGIAVGTGRAAALADRLPTAVRGATAVARRVLLVWLVTCLGVVLLSLALDASTFANILSQLHVDAGDATAYVLVCLLVLPNAAVWGGAYLLGPGFAVGTGTLVSPSGVVLGALPMFPLLAALPDAGTPGAWQVLLLGVAPLSAAVGSALTQRRHPVPGLVDPALRGALGSLLAGVVVGLLAALSGGAVGPDRMADLGPAALDVLAHAVPAFALGGAVGGLLTALFQRHGDRRHRDQRHEDRRLQSRP
ncbi:DUF6350 family protein [Nocardioides sp. GY 10127]|uniref:cell division protein PerM n=1 Tax=Nocardioides sp. GY 10127 TaxID=2569762 RepID=UPI00197EA45D|nr:DUF6350 family protein [Nocardioides sp. GY 10127]